MAEQNEVQIIQTTPSELQSYIQRAIQEELKEYFPQKKIEEEEYLTRKEAAGFLRIGETKLYELKKSGKLPFIREGIQIFFKKSDLIEYRNSCLQRKGGEQ